MPLRVKVRSLPENRDLRLVTLDRITPTPPRDLDRCETKGVAGKAIRKSMKTKGQQKSGWWQ
jgi:hypothetical protein